MGYWVRGFTIDDSGSQFHPILGCRILMFFFFFFFLCSNIFQRVDYVVLLHVIRLLRLVDFCACIYVYSSIQDLHNIFLGIYEMKLLVLFTNEEIGAYFSEYKGDS